MQRIPRSKARNIGVSNFSISHLEALSHDEFCNVVPVVNQVEVCIDLFLASHKSDLIRCILIGLLRDF